MNDRILRVHESSAWLFRSLPTYSNSNWILPGVPALQTFPEQGLAVGHKCFKHFAMFQVTPHAKRMMGSKFQNSSKFVPNSSPTFVARCPDHFHRVSFFQALENLLWPWLAALWWRWGMLWNPLEKKLEFTAFVPWVSICIVQKLIFHVKVGCA